MTAIYFKVLATVYCDTGKESDHTPGEERALLLLYVMKMLRTYAMQGKCKEKNRSRTGVTAPGPAAYVQQPAPDGTRVRLSEFNSPHI